MKDIHFYNAQKYSSDAYEKVEEHIYKTFDDFMKEDCYVTSLSFEQEPDYEEGEDSSDISQYPLEDILDEYLVAVQDFYEEINDGSSNTCVLEFGSSQLEDIRRFTEIVGKHVYNRDVEEDGEVFVKLVVETE